MPLRINWVSTFLDIGGYIIRTELVPHRPGLLRSRLSSVCDDVHHCRLTRLDGSSSLSYVAHDTATDWQESHGV